MFASRRGRIGLAAALVAVAAVVLIAAIGSSDSPSTPDRYTVGANRLCRKARLTMTVAARHHRGALERGDAAPLARPFFTAIGHLHVWLGELEAPDESSEQAVELEMVEFELEKPIIEIIHIASRDQIHTAVKQIESINERLGDLASSMGAGECARLPVATAFSSG